MKIGHACAAAHGGTWFQGELNAVRLSYPNAELCDDEGDWSCVNNPDATMTVVSATCNGCTFVEDPTGKSGLNFVLANANRETSTARSRSMRSPSSTPRRRSRTSLAR
jgi:hypothetical protein